MTIKKTVCTKTFSRTSLVLCLAYLLLTTVCVTWAHITVDLKSYFTLLLVPISLQLTLIEGTGLMDYLMSTSWSLAYFFLVPPMLLALTLVGNICSASFRPFKVGNS